MDRYILKSFIGFFLGGLVVFICIFLAVDYTSQMAKLNASSSALLSYYIYHVPMLIYQMIPVAATIGTIFTLTSLSRSNELVALFSSGVSLARVSAPILVTVAVISLVSFFISDRLFPTLNQKKNYVYYVEIKKQPGLYSTVKTDRIWYRTGNILFNIKSLNPTEQTAQGATFYYFDDVWNLVQMVTAKTVKMKGSQWQLDDGIVSLFAEESSFPLTQSYKSKSVKIMEADDDLQTASNSSDVMSLNQLSRFIEKNKEAGLETLHYEVDYNSKISFAFAGFVMTFLGIPFSVSRERSGGFAKNAGICVGLLFLYWIFYSSGLTVARHGAVPVIVGAWAPNVIMVMLTFVLLLRLKR